MKNHLINILKNLWFPLLILICLIILVVRFATGQGVEIDKAKRLIDVDQTKTATDILISAVDKYPTDAVLWYYFGMAQFRNGEYNSAATSFDKGIVLNEKEPLNYIGRGLISLREGNIQKAEIDFNKAISLTKGKNVSTLNAVAEAYLTDPKWVPKALDLLSKAKTIDGHNKETLLLLGDAYLLQNNGGSAVTSYERAASIDTKDAKAYYKIGLVYLRSRNFKGAEESFLKATQIDPAYTLAYKELGALYYQIKDGPKAVRAYETYLSLTENPEEGKLRYAFFLFMAKDFSKANEIFASLVEQKYTTPTILRFYAFSLYETGDYEGSQNLFNRYLSTAPAQDIEASDYAYHGKLLLKQNQDSLAIISFEKSLSLESNQPDILQLQAETLLKVKKYQDAIHAYEKLLATRTRPLSQDLYALGRAYYFNQQFEKAGNTFQKLTELQPNMTVGYLWLARTNSNLDPESVNGLAKPAYEALIEKGLMNPEQSKKDLMEAYSYLGYYYFIKHNLALSKSYWTRVLEINPDDEKAKEALKAF